MKGKRKKSQYIYVLTKAFLFAAVVFALSGCGMGSGQTEGMPQAGNTPVPVVELPETGTEPRQTEKAEKKEKQEKKQKKKKEEKNFDPLKITKGDLESNFDEAMKHVTICGKKVSFPITLKKLGKDFSFKKYTYQSKKIHYLVGTLSYRGKKIASAWIPHGKKAGDIKNKKIGALDFQKQASSDDCEIDICGIGFDSSKEEMFEIFGEIDSVEYLKDYYEYHKNSNKNSECYIMLTDFEDGYAGKITISYE